MMRSRVAMIFPAAGRGDRLARIDRGECPGEFFYGSLGLHDSLDFIYGDSRKDPAGVGGRLWLAGERIRNRVSGFGVSRQRVIALRDDIAGAHMAISFTDGFSLSLGLYRHVLGGGGLLVGGFHGLADLPDQIAPAFRGMVRRRIARGLRDLDHLFFFGDADRREAVRLFDIPERKTSLFRFGIDTAFWAPGPEPDGGQGVLSVGSDPKRDYETLLAAPIETPLRIVTRLPVHVPSNRADVELVRGNYHRSALTDLELRALYRSATMVVVPVRDVFQPSGYSVTLQAMACGKPVVLSRIKGLWDSELFETGRNCILVAPGDPAALAGAVHRLGSDESLRMRMGEAARRTAVAHFGLARMEDALGGLVERMMS